MSIRAFTLVMLAILPVSIVRSQSRCECQSLFSNLVKKVEDNYIGLALQKETLQTEYDQHKNKFAEKSSKTSEALCASVLQDFLRFFKDGHLFVSEYPKFSEAEAAALKAEVKEKLYDITAIKKYLVENKSFLHAMEGLWTDGSSAFAIIKNTNPGWTYQYVAVIVSSSTPEKVGELKFGLALNEEKMEGDYITNSYASRYVLVNAYKNNSILNVWGGITWGRLAYTDETSIGMAELFNPLLPVVESVDSETVVLTIPSFLIEAKQFYEVIGANEKRIRSASNLIIDIRGNSGGNGIYMELMGLYAEKPLVSEIGYALASADNIAYFEKFTSASKNDPYAPVVADMKLHMGSIVKGPRFATMNIKPIKSKIERVAILTDNGNMSAAETFVLFSKQISSKVMTIGSNTGGVVDYNNINMIPLGCEKRGTMFGYPTYTLNDRIPQKGFNKTGIKPDVIYDGSPNDIVLFALEQLKKQ